MLDVYIVCLLFLFADLLHVYKRDRYKVNVKDYHVFVPCILYIGTIYYNNIILHIIYIYPCIYAFTLKTYVFI